MSEIRSQIAVALRRAQLFAGLTDEEMESLSARAVRKLYQPGEMLFSEGDACAGLYVVAKGHVRIFKTSSGGREQVLGVDGPGSSVAELPVFDGGNYPASVIAVDEAEMIFLSRREFQSFCLEHPKVALKVIAVVGSRLRRLVGIIEELSFTTVRQRVIALLLRYCEEFGRETPRGVEFQLPGSHQELANEIGTVRELVSRNLGRLQAEGLVEVEGRDIVVRNRKALAILQEAEPA